MPLAVALFIRSVLQLIVTAAIYKTAEEFIKVALDALPKILHRAFDIDEEDTRKLTKNLMLDQALAFGLTVVALRTKMPSIVAEKLGFTTKGFAKEAFSTDGVRKLEEKLGAKIPENLTKGTAGWGWTMKIMGSITAIYMLTQSVEVFAYRPQFFVNIAKFFGLSKPVAAILEPPRTPVFSDAEISATTAAFIKAFGPIIEDQDLHASIPITEDYIRSLLSAAEIVVRGRLQNVTQSAILKVAREEILSSRLGAAKKSPPITTKAAVTTKTSKPKIFVGVINSGRLGQEEQLNTTPTSLITDEDTLKLAATTNLAFFLRDLPSRLVYEIASRRNPTTRDGTRLSGVWATMDVFLRRGPNARTKIDSFILGWLEDVKLQFTSGKLSSIGAEITSNILTQDTREIAAISIPSSSPVQTISAVPVITTPQPATPLPQPPPEAQPLTAAAAQTSPEPNFQPVSGPAVFVPPPAAPAPSPTPTPKICKYNAGGQALPSTLFELYAAEGLPLPPITDRAVLYEARGLGPRASYAGTYEQNVALLRTLLTGAGCL